MARQVKAFLLLLQCHLLFSIVSCRTGTAPVDIIAQDLLDDLKANLEESKRASSVIFVLEDSDDINDINKARKHISLTPSSVITFENEEEGQQALHQLLKRVGETSEATFLICVFCRQKLPDVLHIVKMERTPIIRLKFVLLQRNPITWNPLFEHPNMVCDIMSVAIEHSFQAATVYGNLDQHYPCRITNVIGQWTLEGGLKIKPKRSATDFQGSLFRVTMNEGEGFFLIRKRDKGDGRVIAASGIDFHLLKTIAHYLNFSYNVTLPPDKEWGSPIRENLTSWSGMIGQVQREEVDFALSQITVSPEREKVVHFSAPYLFDSIVFISPAPKRYSEINLLSRPYSLKVWLCLLTTLFVAGSAFFCIFHGTERMTGRRIKFRPIWYLIGTFGNQGNQRLPYSLMDSSKILMSFWWIFVLNMLWAYSGTLTSFVSLPQKDKAVDTLDKLWNEVNRDVYSCGAVRGTAYYDILLNTNFTMIKEIGLRMAWMGWSVGSMEEGLRKTAAGSRPRFALVDGATAIRCKQKYMGIKNITFSRDQILDDKYAIAFYQGFPYVDIFDLMIKRILNSGLMGKWLEEQYALLAKQGGEIRREEEENSSKMGLSQLRMAFFVLLGSYGSGTIILLLECVSFRLRPHIRDRQNSSMRLLQMFSKFRNKLA